MKTYTYVEVYTCRYLFILYVAFVSQSNAGMFLIHDTALAARRRHGLAGATSNVKPASKTARAFLRK